MMYIGTLSNEKIIKIIRAGETELLPGRNIYYNDKMTDEEIITDIINKGKIKGGIIHFFAADLQEAIRTAKETELKNFSQVSSKLYEKGKDY